MIQFKDRALFIEGREFQQEYPILDARQWGNLVLVLLRPESYDKAGQFANLAAYDLMGQRKWTAELPTTYSMDSYYQLVSLEPLVADSYCSFRCELDPTTGKIVSKEFYK